MKTFILTASIASVFAFLCGCAALSPSNDAGFVRVFNGQNLDGWKMQGHASWQVEDGDIVGRQDPGQTNDCWLFSEAEWSDFDLELDFKITKNCNSGVAIRMPAGRNGSPDMLGYEVQVSDLPALKLTGSLLHHIQSETNNVLKADEWNHLSVTCENDHIVIYLNGLKTMDTRQKGSKKGRIGMQVPKGEAFAQQVVRFRNIRVKELNSEKVEKSGGAGKIDGIAFSSGASTAIDASPPTK